MIETGVHSDYREVVFSLAGAVAIRGGADGDPPLGVGSPG